MSSRTLRKLQREKEERKQMAATNNPDMEDDSEDEAPPSNTRNAFDMLNEDEEEGDAIKSNADHSTDSRTGAPTANPSETKEVGSSSPKPKKPKKKKGKKKSRANDQLAAEVRDTQSTGSATQPDEIDLALKSLSTNSKDDSTKSVGLVIDEGNKQLYRLLAVESKHLNALNEMKRLFGNVVLENEDEGPATPRRRGRGPQHVDLGGALAARNSPVSRGQGLKGLALKRNPLIMGKEEWPQATSGGLGMELVEKMEDGTVEYRFVHNRIYQDAQRQFELCVESMDPQRMIAMLQFNPYHVSSLLQVSEIAKQQSDHSVSGDLLERALFTFGRSVHSSFSNALFEGKARLDFRRPENREFWLAAWRFTNNLGQRGTWRTAYEWAKLILSLDPEGDPYCVANNLDQLALRGGQSEHYLELSHHSFFGDDLWHNLPNVNISASLAQYRLKQPQACRSTLTKAITTYPWIFTRLFQELNIPHVPKSIWGNTPRTDREKFDTELYIHNAKDLWSTPEAIAFLVEVVESAPSSSPPPPSDTSITLDEARHVLLSGIPKLIHLIPRTFTTIETTSSDPLPPPDDLPSYNPRMPINSSSHRDRELEDEYADLPDLETPPTNEHVTDVAADAQQLRGLSGLFSRLIPWLGQATGNSPVTGDRAEVEIEQAAAEEGITHIELEQRQGRFLELLDRAVGSHGNDHDNGNRNLAIAAGLQAPSGRDDELIMERALATNDEPSSLAQDPRNYVFDDEDTEGDDLADEPSNPPAGSRPDPNLESPPSANISEAEPLTDDRLQRYLAGSGLLRLKEYTTTYGTDANNWPDNEGHELLTEYARKVTQLKNQRTKAFIMNYVLPQGSSKEVQAMVEGKVKGLE